MALSKWATAVHTHCLKTGTGITPPEAIKQFGNPPSTSSAGSILNSALLGGWFRREEWQEIGAGGALVKRTRYFALDKAAQPVKKTGGNGALIKSYFTGMKRCRSVFELGETQ
jgi:hypothetical protein